MLDIIQQKLPPLTEPTPRGQVGSSAAVLVALVDYPEEPAVILTRRAGHLNSHPGQISFPGGKCEEQDENLLVTALRETREEIGLAEEDVEVLAELPASSTRFDVKVSAFLARVAPGQTYQVDTSELDAVFEAPLSFFLDTGNLRYQRFVGDDYDITMPCYNYGDYCIWGFTLRVLIELLNDTMQAGIHLRNL